VKDLVVGDGKTTGITTTMATQLTDWLSSKGIIQAAKDGVSKTLNKLTDQYNAVSERIDARGTVQSPVYPAGRTDDVAE
jgi:flagellar hook-associated protein 2